MFTGTISHSSSRISFGDTTSLYTKGFPAYPGDVLPRGAKKPAFPYQSRESAQVEDFIIKYLKAIFY
jgi:hypothetical protein